MASLLATVRFRSYTKPKLGAHHRVKQEKRFLITNLVGPMRNRGNLFGSHRTKIA
jgi:hypothetical protein